MNRIYRSYQYRSGDVIVLVTVSALPNARIYCKKVGHPPYAGNEKNSSHAKYHQNFY